MKTAIFYIYFLIFLIFFFWCRRPRLKASHELELVESEGDLPDLLWLYKNLVSLFGFVSDSELFFFF
jgi:hypothetical protein